VTELAQDRGVFLMEAMWMKFNPMVRTGLSETLRDGAWRGPTDHRVELHPHGFHEEDAAVLRELGQRPGLARIDAERLLAQHMLARLDRRRGHRKCEPCGVQM